MDNKNNDNLMVSEQTVTFAELADRVFALEDIVNQLESTDTVSQNRDTYQKGTVYASKGRFVAGARDTVAIMDGQNPSYRFWAGAEDPADAVFTVSKNGDIVAKSFATASSGERIVIETASTNTLKFYNDTTLYGLLEVDTNAGDGYINLLAQDENTGLKIYTGVGASAFSSVELLSNGGSFFSEGNASNQYLSMLGAGGGFFRIHNGPSGEFIETDLLPTGDPSISGALYVDASGFVKQSP